MGLRAGKCPRELVRLVAALPTANTYPVRHSKRFAFFIQNPELADASNWRAIQGEVPPHTDRYASSKATHIECVMQQCELTSPARD